MFYLLLLAVTVGISLPISMMRCRKERGKADEYQKLLLQLSELQDGQGRKTGGAAYGDSGYADDGYDDSEDDPDW